MVRRYYVWVRTQLILFSGANRKKLAQTEPKLVSSLVMLMDSSSLKVQCQAALALRNLASDGERPVLRDVLVLISRHREISARDCQSRRVILSSTSTPVNLSSFDSFVCSMRSECLYSPSERISDNRVGLLAAPD
jgi:hypothetical protein